MVAGLALAAVLAIGFNNGRADEPLSMMDFAASHVITAHAAAPEASPVTPVVQRLQPVPPEATSTCKLRPTPVAVRVKTSKS